MKNEIKVTKLPPHVNKQLIDQRAIAKTAGEPFPLDLLPKVVRNFVTEGAESRGANPSIVALPSLITLAACIGTTRRIAAKKDWTAPAILWGAVVARSGSVKSCGYDLSMDLLKDDELKWYADHENEMKTFAAKVLEHKKKLAAWNRQKDGGAPPDEPVQPAGKRLVVDDQTLESLVPLMQENPRGLFQLSDELRGFFDGMSAYSSGGRAGKEESRWLTVFDGRPFNVDRKMDRARTFIPMTGVSVFGTIQPGVLEKTFSANRVESGMLARLLMVMPEPRAKQWVETELRTSTLRRMQQVVDRLKTLEHDVTEGDLKPVVLRLSTQARNRFASFVNSHGLETMEHEDSLAAAWAKLEGYALRFALVDHLTRWASGIKGFRADGLVRVGSINRGIELSRWFASEAERIYADLGFGRQADIDVDARDLKRLVEWLKNHKGTATERDINRGPRRYRGQGKDEIIQQDCNALVRDGIARWVNGRDTREIVLNDLALTGDGDDLPESNAVSANMSPDSEVVSPTTPGAQCDIIAVKATVQKDLSPATPTTPANGEGRVRVVV